MTSSASAAARQDSTAESCSCRRLLLLPFLLCVTALCLSARQAAAQAPDPASIPRPASPTGFVNGIAAPIEQEAAYIHTREFAQLPEELGLPAKIVSMTSRGRFLFVCTLLSIYRVSPRGQVTLFLAADEAVRFASSGSRNVSTSNLAHGGVRSVAFPRRFPRDPRFYVALMETRPADTGGLYYLSDVDDPIEADSTVVEFRYSERRKRVDFHSYRTVFRVGMPVYDHPIKQMLFRWEYLYIGHGDGATQNASLGGGQKSDGLGKILRIIPQEPMRGEDGEDGVVERPYSVPGSNPFVNDPTMLDEVWALGFRNPHTMCFGGDGTLWVGETGRSNVEEVNIARRGRNYGWSLREGQYATRPEGGLLTGVTGLPADDARFRLEYPVAVFGHGGTVGKQFTGQAIAGGCPVENGSPMSGQFYYADFPVTGRLLFSGVDEMLAARTRGRPDGLSVASTKQAVVCLQHVVGGGGRERVRGRRRRRRERGRREIIRVGTLGNATRADGPVGMGNRVDVRFGQGRFGELYWSSKANGKIYLFESSIPGGPSQKC